MKRKQTLASLKKKAWSLLSEAIRREYAEIDLHGTNFCYTCLRRYPWKQMQAGHAIPGRHGAVLFDEEIIRPQCYACNCPGRGMHHIFAARLINEKGLDWYSQKLQDSHKIVKYSKVDMLAKIEEYKARLQALG